VSEKGRLSYAEWEANANKRAQALSKLGIKRGDHVATIFLNGNEVLETYLALMKLGAVIVPLNVRLSQMELHYIVDHSDASALILSHEFEPIIRKIKKSILKVKQYIVSGGDPTEDMVSFEEIYQGESEQEPSVEIEEEDIACILYTAGTTGRPKGVLLTHKNFVWATVNILCGLDYQPDDRVLTVFPLYHAAGFIVFLGTLFVGATNVTLKSFDPIRVMELIEEEKITRMTFPPTVWNFILQTPDLYKYDTSSVRYIFSGSDSMPLETKRKLLENFPTAGLGDVYGMTETSATIASLKPKDALRKMSSVGKPYVNVEIRLVDELGRDVPQGEVGEIQARGPNIMAGYYKNPEETARSLKIDWLCTGDLGKFDKDYFLYIVGRKKDMIISGGENIYPTEIEEILYTHPKILEAAVIGLPDPTWGERIHATVALKEGERLTEQEVMDYCKKHIASFKKPGSVEFVARLPRSSAGKVLKRVLKER